MGSDHLRGRKLAVRCCQGACFGVGFLSTAFVVTVMFWILWCYLGLSIVQVSDSQRRGSPVYSYVPTPRPANRTDVSVVDSSVNAIYKTATTMLTSSDRGATEVPAALEPPKNSGRSPETTQAKGDFADRSRGNASNPTPDTSRGSKPRETPRVNLTSETLNEGFEDGIHPRRIPSTAKENQYEGDGSKKENTSRTDISPTQVDTNNRPKSNYPDLNDRNPSSRDYPTSSLSRRDEIQSSRRSDSDYGDPDFERDYPQSSSRRYDDDDSRRYRDRYDSRDRDRGRDTEDKLSKGDTRVYPDYERDSYPDRRPVDDDRNDQRRRGDYPRTSSRRKDDDYNSRSNRDRYVDRELSRDTDEKFSKDDTRRVYSDNERDRYPDRRPVDDGRYKERRRGDDDRFRSPDDDRYRHRNDSYRYDYPREDPGRFKEKSRERDGIRRGDEEDRYGDEDDYGRSKTLYRGGSRPESRGDRSKDYPPRDRKPVGQDEERIGDDRNRSPANSRSSSSVSIKDRYYDEDYRSLPSRTERDKIIPTRVIPKSSDSRDKTFDYYPDERDRQDDRREDRTRLLYDRTDRPRLTDDRDYRPRESDDRPYKTKLPDDTEYATRYQANKRIDDRDDMVLERSYPSRDVQGSRSRGDYESSRPQYGDDDRYSYPEDDRDRRPPSGYVDDRYRPEYTGDRNRGNRPDDIDRRNPPRDIDERDRSIRPYDREGRPPISSHQEDDRRPPSRYPDDGRQSPRRETPTGSSKPAEDVALIEKKPQNADGRQVDRPLSPQDVIEAAQRQPDTSDLNSREVPVYNPKRTNLTSPVIIRRSEQRGITSSRKRRALTSNL